MLFADAFKYKKWANAELLELGERQLEQLPENDAEFFIRILNHTTVVDSLFISRLSGEAERYSADNTRETPSFAELKARIAQNDAWLVDFARRATADELQRVIAFRFTDGDHGQLSVEEVLLHLLTHGSNHRGMASRTLATHGLERPKDTFTRYLHEAQPGRRELARDALG
ncbi:DinB family protein [Pseudomonas sp. MGal98]|uniref:DinB family protein n=1 Tax=Pseudomonas sp. MGal98 TaxID=3162460 RepID=UPI0032EB4548